MNVQKDVRHTRVGRMHPLALAYEALGGGGVHLVLELMLPSLGGRRPLDQDGNESRKDRYHGSMKSV